MDFIALTLDGISRWVNISEIAAVEADGNGSVIYLKGNSSVHIACDQGINEVMNMIIEGQVADD